jgi:hypothetical protein
MSNYKVELAANKKTLTITVDLTKNQGNSKSGKSELVASSNGNVSIEGTDLKMGLNIYRPV